MDSNLTVEKIYDQYKKGLLGRDSAFQSLKWIIENDPSADVRVRCIKILSRLKIRGTEVYDFIENLVISDSNSYVRFVAVRIKLRDFPGLCSKPILWLLAQEQFPYILKLIYDSIQKSGSWDNAYLKAEFTRILESRFGVIISEVELFLDLEVLVSQLHSKEGYVKYEYQTEVNYYNKYGIEIENFLGRDKRINFYAVEKNRVVNLELNKKRVNLPRSILEKKENEYEPPANTVEYYQKIMDTKAALARQGKTP